MGDDEENVQVMKNVEMIVENFPIHISYGTYLQVSIIVVYKLSKIVFQDYKKVQ